MGAASPTPFSLRPRSCARSLRRLSGPIVEPARVVIGANARQRRPQSPQDFARQVAAKGDRPAGPNLLMKRIPEPFELGERRSEQIEFAFGRTVFPIARFDREAAGS